MTRKELQPLIRLDPHNDDVIEIHPAIRKWGLLFCTIIGCIAIGWRLHPEILTMPSISKVERVEEPDQKSEIPKSHWRVVTAKKETPEKTLAGPLTDLTWRNPTKEEKKATTSNTQALAPEDPVLANLRAHLKAKKKEKQQEELNHPAYNYNPPIQTPEQIKQEILEGDKQ